MLPGNTWAPKTENALKRRERRYEKRTLWSQSITLTSRIPQLQLNLRPVQNSRGKEKKAKKRQKKKKKEKRKRHSFRGADPAFKK
jgi:hypothetical protein